MCWDGLRFTVVLNTYSRLELRHEESSPHSLTSSLGGNNMKLFQSALFEVNVGVGVCVWGGTTRDFYPGKDDRILRKKIKSPLDPYLKMSLKHQGTLNSSPKVFSKSPSDLHQGEHIKTNPTPPSSTHLPFPSPHMLHRPRPWKASAGTVSLSVVRAAPEKKPLTLLPAGKRY